MGNRTPCERVKRPPLPQAELYATDPQKVTAHRWAVLVVPVGVEPIIARLSTVCSEPLSYRTIVSVFSAHAGTASRFAFISLRLALLFSAHDDVEPAFACGHCGYQNVVFVAAVDVIIEQNDAVLNLEVVSAVFFRVCVLEPYVKPGHGVSRFS